MSFPLLDLPPELHPLWIRHLTVGATHNLRMAGFGSRDKIAHTALRNNMVRRIPDLQRVLAYVSGSNIGQLFFSVHAPELGPQPCMMRGFCVRPDVTRFTHAGIFSGPLPRRVPCVHCHLSPAEVSNYSTSRAQCSSVVELQLSHPSDIAYVATQMPLVQNIRIRHCRKETKVFGYHSDKGSGLEGFTQLRSVLLKGDMFRKLQDGLLQLANLERISLGWLKGPPALPSDMGDRLPRLTELRLSYCTTVIPCSVWDTLERNYTPENSAISVWKKGLAGQVGLAVSELCEKKHPRVYKALQCRLLPDLDGIMARARRSRRTPSDDFETL